MNPVLDQKQLLNFSLTNATVALAQLTCLLSSSGSEATVYMKSILEGNNTVLVHSSDPSIIAHYCQIFPITTTNRVKTLKMSVFI